MPNISPAKKIDTEIRSEYETEKMKDDNGRHYFDKIFFLVIPRSCFAMRKDGQLRCVNYRALKKCIKADRWATTETE